VSSSDRKPPRSSSSDALDPTLRADAGPARASGDSAFDTEPSGDAWSSPPSTVQPAAQLGRFRVLRELGRGGMGLTYLAYDEELDRKVAVKLVRPEVSDAEAHARLRREAQALARLTHPNIVHVYEVGNHQGQLFIAMELVPGQTMAAWLEEAPRSWREALAVFRQAGEGLRAAHAAGLVHRDFKPSNVMIGDDGRVRVLDFGLAYLGDGMAAAPDAGAGAGRAGTIPGAHTGRAGMGDTAAPPATAGQGAITGSGGAPLTATGAVMGTPAYMSPEQMAGTAADARSDQFSFCVSLYEALYGDRPHIGATLADLPEERERGPSRDLARASQVPGWLRAVVARGLALEPDRRWPSMDALLAALARDPAHRRRQWLMAGALGAGALGLVAAVWLGVTRDGAAAVCSGARAELAGVWDAGREESLARAMQATGVSYAADTWRRTEGVLDRYADAWVAGYTDACEDTVIRREQPEEIRARRVLCLEGRRQALRSFTELLAQADATAVQKAVQAASGLPRVASCADIQYLSASVAPPEDAGVAARVAALRERLTRAGELLRLGRFADSLALAREVQQAAAQVDYAPIRAEALLRLGEIESEDGKFAEAEASLREAFFLARAADHDEVAYRAAIALVFALGTGLERHADAHEWGRHAHAELERGAPVEERARLLSALGNVLYGQGEYAQAAEHYRRSVALREQALGREHLDVGRVRNNLGNVLRDLGKYEEAAAELGRALAVLERTLGPGHPFVAGTLNNLGIVAIEQGRYEQAAAYYRRAMAIWEAAVGHDHPDVAHAVGNLGIALQSLGQHEEAVALFHRALAIREKTLGPEHPLIAYSVDSLGTVLRRQGRHEEAAAHYRRALAIREKALGREHPLVAESLVNVGLADEKLGRYDEALAGYGRALAILEKTLGAEHQTVAGPLVELARVQLARRRPAEALAAAERALALRSRAEGVAPEELAETRFVLARALVAAAGDRGRAVALARQARDTYLAGPRAARQEELDAVDAWLRAQEQR
jgi:tetratricopeptide (TPR) repeat protein